MEIFTSQPPVNTENEPVKLLTIGVFNLDMKIDELDRLEKIDQLYNDLKLIFQPFIQNYPWFKPNFKVEKFTNVKNWCGIFISGGLGYSIEDINLIKFKLSQVCSKDQNIFITMRVNGDDQFLPDFEEFDNLSGVEESIYKISNWNRFWWCGKYIYKIPLSFMQDQKLNMTLSLEYMLKRNVNKLSRFRTPIDFIDPLKRTLSSFHKIQVKVPMKLAHLIDLNPWLPRCALVEDYFNQEMNPITPIAFPGSSLRKFINLSNAYRMPMEGDDDSELVEIHVLLNTLGASLLENAPFENVTLELKGLMLTNVIELFLQSNNKLPIDSKTEVHFPSSNAVVQDEVSKWNSLLEQLGMNVKPENLVRIHRITNEQEDDDSDTEDVFYTSEDINLDVFKRPQGEDLMGEYFTKFDELNPVEEQIDLDEILRGEKPPNGISEDDFFEFFLKNALKMADDEVEGLRSGIDGL